MTGARNTLRAGPAGRHAGFSAGCLGVAVTLAGCAGHPMVPHPRPGVFHYPEAAHMACWQYSQGQVDPADPMMLVRVDGADEWVSLGRGLSRGDVTTLVTGNILDMGRAIAKRTEAFDAVYRRCMRNIGHVPIR